MDGEETGVVLMAGIGIGEGLEYICEATHLYGGGGGEGRVGLVVGMKEPAQDSIGFSDLVTRS